MERQREEFKDSVPEADPEMFLVNAAFVMCLVAVAMRARPNPEWLSSVVGVVGLGLLAFALQPSFASFTAGGRPGPIESIAMGFFVILSLACAGVCWDDRRDPADDGDAT